MNELSWHDRGRLWLRLGIRLGLFALAAALLLRFGPALISLFAPFLLAAVVAWMLNPAVKWLVKKLNWPRKTLSLLLILLAFAALFGLFWALVSGLAGEIISLAGDWEAMITSLQGVMDTLNSTFSRVMKLLPEQARQTVDDLVSHFFTWLETFIPRLLSISLDLITDAVKGLPSFAVASIVFVMASYFLTSDWPRLRSVLTDKLPEGPQVFLVQVRRAVSAGFGGYIKAQVILSVGVFFILLGGFLLIRQSYGLLLALALAVLDFIPIIGAGTVMVPWAVVDLITGEFRHALGLMVVWGIVALYRRAAEPRVLGNQTGLSPILSLVSVYVGMKVAGVWGMILGPVLCLVVLNILNAGVLDGTLSDLRLAASDLCAILKSGNSSGQN